MPDRALAATSETAPQEAVARLTGPAPLAGGSNKALARLAAAQQPGAGAAVLARQPHPAPAPAPAPAPGAQPTTTPAPGAGSELALYTDAMRERRAYQGNTFSKDPHAPSTGRGLFAAELAVGTLAITVRCSFKFTDSSFWEFPGADDAETEWQPGEADRWKATFMEQVRSVWSGQHTFYCQKDWWEDERVTTDIRVVESDDDPHFDCTVQKIPSGERKTSSVTAPMFGGWLGGGDATLDSNDINPETKRAGVQRPGVHEAGHMLGLGDEYGDSGEAAHSALNQAQGGAPVAKSRDGRIMSNGEQVGTAHGATFLEVLEEITGMDWDHAPKTPPRPVPAGAPPREGEKGDFPVPSRGPGAAVPA